MRHYLFECVAGENEGEEFIVEADSYRIARAIAEDLFGKVRFWHILTEEEAEASGLDEY